MAACVGPRAPPKVSTPQAAIYNTHGMTDHITTSTAILSEQAACCKVPVGWNCTRSRSCMGRPARLAMELPLPVQLCAKCKTSCHCRCSCAQSARLIGTAKLQPILRACSSATWTLVAIINDQVHSKVLDGEQNLNFRAILDAYGNAAWTLAVLTNDQVHGRVLDGGQNNRISDPSSLHIVMPPGHMLS